MSPGKEKTKFFVQTKTNRKKGKQMNLKLMPGLRERERERERERRCKKVDQKVISLNKFRSKKIPILFFLRNPCQGLQGCDKV